MHVCLCVLMYVSLYISGHVLYVNVGLGIYLCVTVCECGGCQICVSGCVYV